MIMEETKTILQTSHRLRYTLIIEGFLVGGCAGIISIVYRQLLAYAEEWVQWLSAMMRQSVMWAAAGFALLALIALGTSALNVVFANNTTWAGKDRASSWAACAEKGSARSSAG